MNSRQVLELIGDLPQAQMRELWSGARSFDALSLRRGVWFGRNAGMALPAKLAAKHLVRRDFFSKLVLDGWGVNVRVRQDGTFSMIHDAKRPMAVRVDLPFRLGPDGLDYALPVLGSLLPGKPVALRDYLREMSFADLVEAVSIGQLRRVGAQREFEPSSERAGDGKLILGYMAPLGLGALKGTPFGMLWQRDATPSEIESAERLRPVGV